MTVSSDIDVRRDRARGALLGLACGDAVGTTVEFAAPGSFEPVTDMVGGRLAAKAMFTKADNYVLQIQRPLEEPLRSLVIASVFAVDTGLRQGNFDNW